MRVARAIADTTGKHVTLTDANGLEFATVKGRGEPSRTDQALQVTEAYASVLQEICKKLRKQFN